MPTSPRVRAGLAVLALTGALGAAAGMVDGFGRSWPRWDALALLGVALAACVTWSSLALRAGPADGWPARLGRWRVVIDAALVVGGVCVLAMPTVAGVGHPDLVALRDGDPEIGTVAVVSVDSIEVRKDPKYGTHYRGWVTVEMQYPHEPRRRLRAKVSFEDNPVGRTSVYALYSPSHPSAGVVLSDDRAELEHLLHGVPVDWLLCTLVMVAVLVSGIGGLEVRGVRGLRDEPPGGHVAHATLEYDLRRGAPMSVLRGRLETTSELTSGAMLAFRSDRVSRPINLPRSTNPERVMTVFTRGVTLAWLPEVGAASRNIPQPALLISTNGWYVPVSVARLPELRPSEQPLELRRPFGLSGWTRADHAGIHIVAMFLAIAAGCLGLVIPMLYGLAAGTGFGNEAVSGLGLTVYWQSGVLVVALLVVLFSVQATRDRIVREALARRQFEKDGVKGGKPAGRRGAARAPRPPE